MTHRLAIDISYGRTKVRAPVRKSKRALVHSVCHMSSFAEATAVRVTVSQLDLSKTPLSVAGGGRLLSGVAHCSISVEIPQTVDDCGVSS